MTPRRRAAALIGASVAIFVPVWLLLINKPQPSPKPTPTASASPPPAASPTVSADRLAAAVQAAFPDGAEATDDDGAHYRFETHKLVAAPFGPVLVSEGKAEDAAHVTSGRLDIFYLKANGDGFTVARRFPVAVQAGSFGEMSEWSVGDRIAELPVIDAEGGFTGQGYTCGYAVLTELAAAGPVELAQVQTGYDDSGAVEDHPQTITGTITDIDRGKAFSVKYTGTKTFTERWVRKGAKFVRQGATQLPAC